MPIEFLNLTAAIIRLPERLIFTVSVYVEEDNVSALDDACNHLLDTITKIRQDTGVVVEILIIKNFNRHNQLWKENNVSLERQGEVDLIVDLINKYTLSSLLRQNTKIWYSRGHSGDCESTIDLILASGNLTDSVIRYTMLGTEYGSDYCTIETVFDTPWSLPKYQKQFLLKNIP